MEQLKLNMIPNGVNPVFHASQYDKGRQIRFVLDETLSSAEVTTSYRAKDGTEHGNVQTSVSGNTITDTIPEEVLTDYGIIEGEVNIDGIGSLNFFVEVEKDAYDGGVITTQTASGPIATFETNMVEPFKSLKSDINPVQSGTGTPSPNNPRPISGFNGATIVRCGANLVKKQALMQFCPMASGTKVYAQLFDTTAAFSLYIVKKGLDPTITANWTSFLSLSTTKFNNTLPFDISHIGISNSAYSSLRTGNIMVSLSDITEFIPYNGQTATVNFGQTVYGGVVDVTNGKLKITHKVLSVDNNSALYSLGNSAYLNVTDAKIVNEYASAISDKYEYNTWSGATNGDNNYFTLYQYTTWSNARLAFNRNGLSLEDFITSLTNNPIQVVYELATPIEITTTPENLTAISGENNVYSDTNGDTTVEYYIEV